jgi:hypothetical protein
MTRYYFSGITPPHGLLGALLIGVPLAGLWMGRDFSGPELLSASPFWTTGLLVLFGRRGVAYSEGSREFRVWFGLGFTRALAWPVWRRAPSRFEFVVVRLQSRKTGPYRGGGALSSFPGVWMVDERGGWVLVSTAWTVRGAERKAERICAETGLPHQE